MARERNEKEKKMGHKRHINSLFLTHLILLERLRRNDFNYTLKEYQMKL
jgi:hypothetical protein